MLALTKLPLPMVIFLIRFLLCLTYILENLAWCTAKSTKYISHTGHNKCLPDLSSQLIPFKQHVIRALAKPLDDKKRLVRKEAVEARCQW